MASEKRDGGRQIPVLGIVCASLIPVAALYSVGKWFKGWRLDLGSFNLPTPVHTYFLFFYTALGLVGVAGLTVGFAGLLGREDRWSRLKARLDDIPDRWWMGGAALLAFAIPMFVRLFVLDGARLTDDESAYLFMANLLGDGQVTAASHPAREFFDRFAMVNDGRYYSQYFLGWPAMLGPFAWLGIPEIANPVYSAATAVGLYVLVRRVAGSPSAKGATALYLVSPFTMAMAATMLSHIVCLGWLVWAMWAMARTFDDDPPVWADPLLAVCFSAAFFTRPTVALGIGGPFLIAWLVHLVRHRRDELLRAMALFAVPAAALAAVFFAVNYLQTGHPLTPAYEVAYEYRRVHIEGKEPGRTVPNMAFSRPGNALAMTVMALVRFNYAAWGWICAFLFVPLAIGARRRWTTIAWGSLAGFLLVHFPMTDSGVDSFGPVHYFELILPVLLLTVAGIGVVIRWCARRAGPVSELVPVRAEVLPAALVAALVYASLVMYVPVRWGNLSALAEQHNEPREAVREAGVDRAVIFANSLFIRCAANPDGFVGWPPINPPGNEADILWANHLTLERDREFLREYYPNRPGYLLDWDRSCEAELVPLEELAPEQVRPGMLADEDKAER
jgi:hypothetical protein